jgi:hypothetical protein
MRKNILESLRLKICVSNKRDRLRMKFFTVSLIFNLEEFNRLMNVAGSNEFLVNLKK